MKIGKTENAEGSTTTCE